MEADLKLLYLYIFYVFRQFCTALSTVSTVQYLEANKCCDRRPHSKLLTTLLGKIIQTKKPFHWVLLSVLERKSQSAMMKHTKMDDKERIIEEERENPEKVPKIQVLQSKVLTATKKPGCLGIALASFAVILSLAVFITFLGYMGMLPQKVRLTKGYQKLIRLE